MNSVGVDVSNGRSMVTVFRPPSEKVSFEVRHDAVSLSALARELNALNGEIRVVIEHTGRYYESVTKPLHRAGLFASAVNPLLIKEYGGNSLHTPQCQGQYPENWKYDLNNWTELRDYTLWMRIGIT